jgi:phage/plasmid-like protein (TIGR03299 family)
MADKIDTAFIRDLRNRQADDAETSTDSWHGKGTRVKFDEVLSREDLMVKAGWTWTMEKEPCYQRLADGSFVASKTDFFVVRSDNRHPLGVVGDKFEKIQFADAVDSLWQMVEAGLATPEAGGVLDEGKYSWLQLRFCDPIEIVAGDEMQRFALWMQGHVGNMAGKFGPVDIRSICWNTCSAALKDDKSKIVNIRHAKKAVAGLSAVVDAFDVMRREFLTTAEEYKAMAHFPISAADMRKYFTLIAAPAQFHADELKGKGNGMVEKIIDQYESGAGREKAPGTLWSAFQAITAWNTHTRTVKGDNAAARQQSVLIGTNAKDNAKAREIAMAWMALGRFPEIYIPAKATADNAAAA